MEERAKDIASSFVTHVHKMASMRTLEADDIISLSVRFCLFLVDFCAHCLEALEAIIRVQHVCMYGFAFCLYVGSFHGLMQIKPQHLIAPLFL